MSLQEMQNNYFATRSRLQGTEDQLAGCNQKLQQQPGNALAECRAAQADTENKRKQCAADLNEARNSAASCSQNSQTGSENTKKVQLRLDECNASLKGLNSQVEKLKSAASASQGKIDDATRRGAEFES